MSSLPTADLAADPRVERGMRAQLATRAERIDAGERPLGWKLGFGTAQFMERHGTGGPLVGFLMRSGLIESGSAIPIGGFANAVLEPEVAAHIGSDLPAGAGDAAAEAAIAGLGPAFELADLDPPPDDVERILEGNVYQRGVVLGQADARRSLAGVTARVVVNGEPTVVEDPEGPTGPLIALIRHVADLLAAFDERLRAGDVVICGALVPPMSVSPGDRVDYELDPVGTLSVTFEA
jgi:2-keto-4-pentenoate hydratase